MKDDKLIRDNVIGTSSKLEVKPVAIQNIIEKEYHNLIEFLDWDYSKDEDKIKAILQSSLTELLDSVEREIKENSPSYNGDALDTNNNRRWYDQGFGENRQEVINIINSHR